MKLDFSYLDFRFGVRSNCPSSLQWLHEFMHPFFEVEEGQAPADVEIELTHDPEKFQSLLHRGPAQSGRYLDAFTLDNHTIRLPRWNAPGRQLTLYEEKFQVFYTVSNDRRQVQLLARDFPRYRIPLMRVLREYVMNTFMQRGGVYFHASSVVFGDKGLLIVGRKNAGKTSLMTHFLRHAQADYLANDRVFVQPDASPMFMRGMPTIATIRSSMPPLFPGLQGQLDRSVFFHHLTLEESIDRNRRLTPWGDGRYGLTPAQLLRIHGARPRAQARPVAMVFPRVDPDASGMNVIPIAQDDVASRIPDALFGALTLRNSAEVFNFEGGELPSVDALRSRCARVAGSLPCYEIRMGRQAYDSPRDSDKVLARILADQEGVRIESR